MADLILIGLIAAGVIAALRRGKKKGCGGCCRTCGQACPDAKETRGSPESSDLSEKKRNP